MFIEVLKISIPALIVAAVSYFLIKELLRNQNLLEAHKLKRESQATTLPLQLQAYERLSVLCERLSLPGLVMRTQSDQMQSATLKIALLMAIQQEFEHNISQQVYVSDQLWKIIQTTREDLLQFISMVGEKVDPKSPGHTLAMALVSMHEKRGADPIATAQMAIRREAALLF